MAEVRQLRGKQPDNEKITINLGFVDLGRIDLLVQEGFYSNRSDFIRTIFAPLAGSLSRLASAAKDLVADGRAWLAAQGHDGATLMHLAADMRYHGQSYEIELPLQAEWLAAGDMAAIVQAFHKMHERIYSIRSDNDVVEFTAWKLRAIGLRRGRDQWKEAILPQQQGAPAPKTRRPVYDHAAGGPRELPVYDLATLGADAEISGPALVEAATFTAYLKSGHDGCVDAHGNLVVAVA